MRRSSRARFQYSNFVIYIYNYCLHIIITHEDLVPRVLGEHAQVQQGPGPGRELDDDEGVVEDVGRPCDISLLL